MAAVFKENFKINFVVLYDDGNLGNGGGVGGGVVGNGYESV